jgi:hypothetical protein
VDDTEKVLNLRHCAEFISNEIGGRLTVEEILEVLELETDYMVRYGYAEED